MREEDPVSYCYIRHALAAMPRALSMQDREPGSPTRGCFDRTYWGWKFTDFPGARFQEGVCALGHAFRLIHPENPYAGQMRMVEWSGAGLEYWITLQNRDGSFDEAYPGEHSLAATAFTTFYAFEALRLIGDCLPRRLVDSIRDAVARAGGWLCRNSETHGILSNHLAAAAAALHGVWEQTGEARFARRRDWFVARILDHQSSEGWLEEYGGADLGYQTHAIYYLASIWKATSDGQLLEALHRAVDFQAHLVHPNGTLGGEYASRNTEFYFPAGFEILAGKVPGAANIALRMRPTVATQTGAGLAVVDPYNFFPLLNNYFAAASVAQAWPVASLPCDVVGEKNFPDAGLYLRSTRKYFAVLGTSKGGVLKVWDRQTGRHIWSDSGYVGHLDSGRRISSQHLRRPPCVTREGNSFRVEINFVQAGRGPFSPGTFLVFRITTLLLGWLPWLAKAIKQLLVWSLIRHKQSVGLRLIRQVTFTDDEIAVHDNLLASSGMNVPWLSRCDKFSSLHMGSARYFQVQELEPPLPNAMGIGAMLTSRGRASSEYTVAL